jgi:hypothetical protein
MIIGYARVSTTEQNLGLRHDDLKPAFDASVDPTEASPMAHNVTAMMRLKSTLPPRMGASFRQCPMAGPAVSS